MNEYQGRSEKQQKDSMKSIGLGCGFVLMFIVAFWLSILVGWVLSLFNC